MKKQSTWPTQRLSVFTLARYAGLLGVVALAGCSRYLPVVDRFGAVTSPDVDRSHNGLGLHIRMWEATGARCIMPQKLTPRLDDVDVIVLVGKSYAPPGLDARRWLEDWLDEKQDRAVIYFGRDLNAEAYYRNAMLQRAGSDKAEHFVSLASVKATELGERIDLIPESTFCRWFYLDSTAKPETVVEFAGPWSDGLEDLRGNWPTGIRLLPPEESQAAELPSWLAAGATAGAPNLVVPFGESSTVKRSRWRYDELDTKELWEEEFEDIQSSPSVLLATSDDKPLVFELAVGDNGGKIMIVNNGAPFLNATLVDPLHRRVAEKIVDRYSPASEVAFIGYDQSGILLSTTKEPDSRAAGLEMFLTWPIGAITMPLMLSGILTCIALFPILGRAKSLPQRDLGDFGMHVDSMGSLLAETGDEAFAQNTIRAYFRRVRGESPPAWMSDGPLPVESETQGTSGVELGDTSRLAESAIRKDASKTDPINETDKQ
ncbi:MAG: hypothetical protein Aurels2KO_09080 [Aureliella sp.]